MLTFGRVFYWPSRGFVFKEEDVEQLTPKREPGGIGNSLLTTIGRILLSLFVPLITFYFLREGFLFLRESDANKLIIVLVAIIWGVGGVALLYIVANWFVERLGPNLKRVLLPYVFVGPAIAILFWYLAFPALRTLYISLFGRNGPSDLFDKDLNFIENIRTLSERMPEYWDNFVGLSNYSAIFSNDTLVTAFRNNLLWIVFGATFSIAFGLIIAVLADRSKFEKLAKSLIFLPMAISFVGAGVIWNFIYEVKDISVPQIGLLNAIVVGLGGEPQAWTALNQPWNNLFLIVIVVWLQTGFAMVLFSAALKGIPAELMEAARVDGASEVRIFFNIMIPYIMGTIVTVSTTVIIFTLKIFDVVWVMTGGQFGTQVIATQFFRESFVNSNSGFGSAIVIILLIAVIPVMIYNLRQFGEQEGF
ncbi:MAG: sugar ABC transporter permease [Chloroflexi bacterium]|nr:sugar ABC transporter permease [Chloroflexota bacterium]